MLPDLWSSVHHLLLCSAHLSCNAAYGMDALALIQQTLPQANVQWLLVDANNDYRLVSDLRALPSTEKSIAIHDPFTLIETIQTSHFDAAIILTNPGQSPYQLAYLCYLAGIPIRLGQSQEFGGGVLSHCIKPPLDAVSPDQYILHLLTAVGLAAIHPEPAIV